jgi:hypothetical protein
VKALAATLAAALVVVAAAASSPPPLPVSATVAPDRAHIAWVDGVSWQVWAARVDGTHAHKVGKPWPDGVGQVTWTRDGLVVDSNYTLFLLAPSGKRTKLAVVPDSVFSVGGDLAAVGTGQVAGPASVVDLRTHRAVRVGGTQSVVGEPSLSADGRRLAWTAGGAVWDGRSDGSGVRRFVARGTCPAWSPNGRLAYEAVRGASVDLVVGRRLLLTRMGGACPPAWSPSSTELAVPYGTGRLALVNVRTGAVYKTPVALGRVTGFAWVRDGTLVASFRSDTCGNVVRLDARTHAATTLVRGCP